MNIVRKLLVFTIRSINTIFLKRQQIIMASSDGYRGNIKALAQSIQKNTNYTILWIAVNSRSGNSFKSHNLPYINVYSFQYWIAIFTSKWLISTHGELGRFKAFRKQYFINLWHGSILKKLGNMWSCSEGAQTTGVCDIADITTCSSEFQAGIFALCFNTPMWNMSITGAPRNDWLHDVKKAKNNLHSILEQDFSKIILYCPTHRKAEGKNTVQESPWCYDDFKKKYLTKEFQIFLEENNFLFVVKLHPFEEQQLLKDNTNNSVRIIYITGEILDEKKIDLYEILAGFDLLITDYSSLYIDFLITKKPIIFMTDDLDEYNNTRGFVLDMYEELTPGPKVCKSTDLITEIKLCLNSNSYYDNERTKANKLLNSAVPPYTKNIINLMLKK